MSEKKPSPSHKPRPHYHGHRMRLRERFAQSGQDALADYELLELLLFRAIPRRDVKGLAKTLIENFGGFAEVLGAAPERLAELPGMTDGIARELKIIHAASLRLHQAGVMNRPVVSSWSALLDYCRAALAQETREQFRVFYLDRKNRLIADEVQNRGTVDHTPVYPREVLRRALELGASAVILVHNHPSGDPTPSKSDIEMTREVITAARALKISVHDHIIVGREDVVSFKALGLM
jgi:DNA repair protein RadC